MSLGLFAIPEIVDLLIKKKSISGVSSLGKGWWDGLKDALKNKFIIFRCAIIGVIVGIIPGLGAAVVDWIAYGHVIQTTKDKSKFGKGDIRGVIAPESANNAKTGGMFIPTFIFGIPGSSSMAVFLGGLLILGMEPGPKFMTEHLDLVYLAVWSLALSNVIGAALCLILAKPIARLTLIPFSYIAPYMVLTITLAAYQTSTSWGDWIVCVILGVMGWIMRRAGIPRAPALIGFVLTRNIEKYLFISIQHYGADWLTRTGVVIMGLIVIVTIFGGFFKKGK